MPIERFEAIAYPRAAVGNDPPLEQVTTRPAAEFHEYVLTYSRAQRANVGLIFLGAAVAIGAAFYLSDGWLIAGAALGLGLAGGGGAGFLIAAGAHAAYTLSLIHICPTAAAGGRGASATFARCSTDCRS